MKAVHEIEVADETGETTYPPAGSGSSSAWSAPFT